MIKVKNILDYYNHEIKSFYILIKSHQEEKLYITVIPYL